LNAGVEGGWILLKHWVPADAGMTN